MGLFTFARLVGKYAKGLYRQYPELILDYHGREVAFSAREPITVVVGGCFFRCLKFSTQPARL